MLINLHQEIWECYSNFLIEWFFQFAHITVKSGEAFFTRKFVSSNFLSKWQLKNTADKLHCIFIKQILGINSKASNWAVLGETNNLPWSQASWLEWFCYGNIFKIQYYKKQLNCRKPYMRKTITHGSQAYQKLQKF